MELSADPEADLIVGATYKAGKGLAGEPISRLLPVGNMGGIRFGGPISMPNFVSLFSTFNEPEWPDTFEFDHLTYWGDNRSPGRDLHDTPKRGNVVLRNLFQTARTPAHRWRLPLITLFAHNAGTRDVKLLAILVPGGSTGPAEDDLVAVWRRKEEGWFQNYRATFTALTTDSVTRHAVSEWPNLDRSERCHAVPGFEAWIDSAP